MTDGKTSTGGDADISPMEAQNTGQGRTGPVSDGPLPRTQGKTGEVGAAAEDVPRERIAKGGEQRSRDDL